MISSQPIPRVRTLFLQCVCLCYSIAFHSLYTQIPGLYGDHGISPARTVISQLSQQTSSQSTLSVLFSNPTLLLFHSYVGLSVQQAMEVLCLLGTVIGIVLTLQPQYITKLMLFLLWLAYISLYQVGQTFLHFQWDILLLETGMLALILSPVRSHQHKSSMVQDPVTMFLVRWLLFRMMFASGVVKVKYI